jgi:hypothetical protein
MSAPILLAVAGLSTWVERIMQRAGLEASIAPGQRRDLDASRGRLGVLNFG